MRRRGPAVVVAVIIAFVVVVVAVIVTLSLFLVTFQRVVSVFALNGSARNEMLPPMFAVIVVNDRFYVECVRLVVSRRGGRYNFYTNH